MTDYYIELLNKYTNFDLDAKIVTVVIDHGQICLSENSLIAV